MASGPSVLDTAARLGISAEFLELYGPGKAKIRLELLKTLQSRPVGKYVVVTAMTPTAQGEGKTTSTIGLVQGLSALGKRAIATLRQPSLGPIFGVKGGATGGGMARLVPSQEISLHFTGDFHAVAAAHNLLASFVDHRLQQGNELGLEKDGIFWRRTIDLNDRALRRVVLFSGTPLEREGAFDITAASEVMSILTLAVSYRDLRERLGRIVVARRREGSPATAEDLRCAGAMAALLREALKPNLVQTGDGTPALVHSGPFANVGPGNSSVLADEMALRLAEYTVTESGFGSELGYEKFCDLKCRVSGRAPDAAVVVASVRALKAHGAENLAHHIGIVRNSGVPAVVAINRFSGDSASDVEQALRDAKAGGAAGVAVSDAFISGAEGARDLAAAVIAACAKPGHFKNPDAPAQTISERIERLATGVYGADGVDYSDRARERLALLKAWGYDALPVCMAKTPLSISDKPALTGVPKGFRVKVDALRLCAGAGFVVVRCGGVVTMPGLPPRTHAEHMDLDAQGEIVGMP